MLKIENLKVNVEGKEILRGVNLKVKPGEVHAIMGPNGAGKSTLANVLAGHESYEVTSGTVELAGQDLLALAPEERRRRRRCLKLYRNYSPKEWDTQSKSTLASFGPRSPLTLQPALEGHLTRRRKPPTHLRLSR